MVKTLKNSLSIVLSALLLLPPQVFAAAGEKDIEKVITSAEGAAKNNFPAELSIAIGAAFFSAADLPNLKELFNEGQAQGLWEFKTQYENWIAIVPKTDEMLKIAFDNTKKELISTYTQELDCILGETVVHREVRLVLESKLFAVQHIYFEKGGSITLSYDLKNPKIVSELSREIVGREIIEKASLEITKGMDITGKASPLGYSFKNLREAVVYMLNGIVEDRYTNATTKNEVLRERAFVSSFEGVRTLRKIIATKEGANSLINFLHILERRLSKGGMLGIGAVAVAGGGMMLLSSSAAQAQGISNSRLALTRALKDTYRTSPELLASKIVVLKQIYGAPLVASVLSENQIMLPAVEQQFAYMAQPKVQAQAMDIYRQLTGEEQQEQAAKKAELTQELKNKKSDISLAF